MVAKTVVVRFIRKLRGGSQPILAQASDGALYVVKFQDNPQGPNLMFNECSGTELYRACGLLVPDWRPVFVARAFLDAHPECWFEMPEGRVRPSPGWCFGSRLVDEPGTRFVEVLPRTAYNRVRNRWSFWLAWLVDVCASHADNRQAVFIEYPGRQLDAVFIDHGFLFGGATGLIQTKVVASRYLDPFVYVNPPDTSFELVKEILCGFDATGLRKRLSEIPEEWRSKSAQEVLDRCIEHLSEPLKWERILCELFSSQGRSGEYEYLRSPTATAPAAFSRP